MTIAIAVSVSEGLVLAADSRTTRWRQTLDDRLAEVLTDKAVKVFPLGEPVVRGLLPPRRAAVGGQHETFRHGDGNRNRHHMVRCAPACTIDTSRTPHR